MASGIDIIIKAIDEASKDIERVKNKIAELEKAQAAANKAQQEGVSITDAFSGVLGGFAKGLGVAAGQIAAAGVILKQAFDFGEQGAALTRLADNSALVAKSMGADMGEIVAAIRTAANGTVADSDIMAAASRAMMLGISADADKLANLMQVAALRGRAMGVSTTQAFSDIVTGIGRMSPLILDNLGIVIDAENNFKAYAESIGKTTEQLTSAEKKQALLNAVLLEGNKMLEQAGGLTMDAASQYEMFNANVKNLKDNLAMGWAEILGPTIEEINNLTNSLVLLDEATKDGVISSEEAYAIQMALKGGMIDYAGVVDYLAVKEEELITVDNDLTNARLETRDMINKVTAASKDATVATEDLAAAQLGAAEAARIQALAETQLMDAVKFGISGGIGKAMDDYFTTLDELKVKHDDLQTQLTDLMDRGYGPTSEKVLDLRDAMLENEDAQRDAAIAMAEATTQMIFQQAAAGLDAGATLALAYAMGMIDESSFNAGKAIMDLKTKYDINRDGIIDSAEATAGYVLDVLALNDAIAKAQSKGITFTVDLILRGNMAAMSFMGGGYTGTGTSAAGKGFLGKKPGAGLASGGAFDVPGGHPNDSYGPIWLTSGEHVEVTPAGKTMNGSAVINNYFNVPNEAVAQSVAKIIARQIKQQGVIA
jgi:hypothetical protein